MIAKGLLQTASFRRRARECAVPSAAAVAPGAQPSGQNVRDWAPVAPRLKGAFILIISLYLGSNSSVAEGIDGRELASLAAFPRSVSSPWIIRGDFDRSQEEFQRSGWPGAPGATGIASLLKGQNTRFLGDAKP